MCGGGCMAAIVFLLATKRAVSYSSSAGYHIKTKLCLQYMLEIALLSFASQWFAFTIVLHFPGW